MAIVTYGVDLAYIQTFYPQLQVSPTSPVTAGRITTMISAAAGELNARIVATFGASAPQEIVDGRDVDLGGDGSQADAYYRCQALVFDLMHWRLVAAAAHVLGDATDQELLREQTETLRNNLRKDPRAQIGYIASPDTYVPGVDTSTNMLGLDMSLQAQRQRRTYGGRGYGRDEKSFKF